MLESLRLTKISQKPYRSMQVKWLARALANLTDEADYIAKESPANAKAFSTHILTSVGQLKQNTHI